MHAQLPQMFDANQVAPDTGAVGQLPVGEHLVQITGSEIKTIKSGDGGLVEFTLVVIDGPNKGATGAYRLNLFNPSEQASNIARAQLSALCHVTGRYQVSDLSVLSGIPFRVVVAMQKGSDQYTEVKKVMDANGNPPGKGGGQAAQQPQGGPPANMGQQPQQPQQAPQGQQGQQGGGWGQQAQQAPAQQQQQSAPAQQGSWGQPQQDGQQQQGQQPQQWQQGNAGGSAPWGGGQG